MASSKAFVIDTPPASPEETASALGVSKSHTQILMNLIQKSVGGASVSITRSKAKKTIASSRPGKRIKKKK